MHDNHHHHHHHHHRCTVEKPKLEVRVCTPCHTLVFRYVVRYSRWPVALITGGRKSAFARDLELVPDVCKHYAV